jgi:hypothetical protein
MFVVYAACALYLFSFNLYYYRDIIIIILCIIARFDSKIEFFFVFATVIAEMAN